MKIELPDVITPEEIAELTRTSKEAVIAALDAGCMPGFRIGAEWRMLKEKLFAFMAGETEFNGKNNRKIQESCILEVKWQQVDSFVYNWPKCTPETYNEAYEANVDLPSGRYRVKIGYTTRKAAGMKNRCRIVVFLTVGSQLIPVVEFAGANDFAKTQLVASVIKDKDGRHIRSEGQLPLEYKGMPTRVYSDIVAGSYAAHGLAVIADKNDRGIILHHALIRARYKGWLKG